MKPLLNLSIHCAFLFDFVHPYLLVITKLSILYYFSFEIIYLMFQQCRSFTVCFVICVTLNVYHVKYLLSTISFVDIWLA